MVKGSSKGSPKKDKTKNYRSRAGTFPQTGD